MSRGEKKALLDDSAITEVLYKPQRVNCHKTNCEREKNGCHLFSQRICQASGLAGSGRSPGLLWTVTDKGGPAKVHNASKLLSVIIYFTLPHL